MVSNFIWRFAERCGAQLVTFIVSISLARILAPEDYGTIALVTVFTTILQVFVDSGLGTALIQKKNADYFSGSVCVLKSKEKNCSIRYGTAGCGGKIYERRKAEKSHRYSE